MDHRQEKKVIKQIDKMTRSVKQHKEEEIYAITDQLIQDQARREEVYYGRKEFLDANYASHTKALSGRVERAAVGKPFENEPENKAQKSSTQKSSTNYMLREKFKEKKNAGRRAERRKRKTLEKNEKFKFIKSKSFATEYQYEPLANARGWMLKNPEAYEKNKETVDAIYKDLYAICEVYGKMSWECQYYQDVTKDPAATKEVRQEADRRLAVLSERVRFVTERIASLSDALLFLLQGKNITDLTKETLQEYMDIGPTETQKQEAAKRAAEAELHADY